MTTEPEIYKVTDYNTGHEYYFCSLECAESGLPKKGWNGGEPEMMHDYGIFTEELPEVCALCKKNLFRREGSSESK